MRVVPWILAGRPVPLCGLCSLLAAYLLLLRGGRLHVHQLRKVQETSALLYAE